MIQPHQVFGMVETSQVGEARRAAVGLAGRLGLDDVAAGRVALIATELGNNLVRHARGGQMLVAAVTGDSGSPSVEIISVDSGPGMVDVSASMVDGHSTGGTPGTGMGAVRRLSTELFDIFSSVPAGTVVVSRVSMGQGKEPAKPFRCAAVVTPIAGEQVSGDAWGVVQQGDTAAVLMADGLGHGPLACEAAQAAVATLMARGLESPSALLDKVHARLRSTRGAAVLVAHLASSGEVKVCGAGNIAGRLLNALEDRTILSQHGTAGVQMRTTQDQRYTLPAHGMLVMHSDGLKSRWTLKDTPGLIQRHPAVIAAWLWRDNLRGRDDAGVLVLKRHSD